jgi:hypothetical protein
MHPIDLAVSPVISEIQLKEAAALKKLARAGKMI